MLPRLKRVRHFLGRPVAWGAVLLSYVGIIAVVAYSANIGATNEQSVRDEAVRANAAIVYTGRAAIESGCKFDNQRAAELQGILQRGIKNQKLLRASGAIKPDIAAQNIRFNREAVKAISLRDCKAAALVLSSADQRE